MLIMDITNGNSFVKNTKIAVLLRYLRNFWESLEIPFTNCKVHHGLDWIEDCILSVEILQAVEILQNLK